MHSMRLSWAPVTENRAAATATRWLVLECPEVAETSEPGQFVMAGFGLSDVGAPFLPRPYSIAWRSANGELGLLVREYGAGSARLCAVRPGERVLLLGPLGRGFRVERERPVTCVAGGVGLAPFLFVATESTAAGGSVRLVYGERTAEFVFDPELVRRLAGVEPEVWTEDGSLGGRGVVLDGLEASPGDVILGCGPEPMLRALARTAREARAELQVSVEAHMGCGVGTCQGCVVSAADGRWVRACVEGPVFEAEELRWPA